MVPGLAGDLVRLAPIGDAGAVFSADQQHRYRRWRGWGDPEQRILFVMLNPSTADELQLDPTVRRCVRFAQRWGYGALAVGNIFSLRSTDPAALYGVVHDHQRHNWHLRRMAELAQLVIAAWGVHGAHQNRGAEVARILGRARPLRCVGITKGGHPRHPLYLPGDSTPVPFMGHGRG